MDIQTIIVDRSKTHGNWERNAAASQAIKKVFVAHSCQAGICLESNHREALDMIALKLSRIITGDPDFRDHWDDIAGYAKLVADRCSK
jgi:hypothetical protein